ncbi:MAG: dCTP deaminase [Candidatus Helarchaeota archaeon]
MIIPDYEIIELIKKKEIIINPFNVENVGPCSVDLHLNNTFSVFKMGIVVDPKDPKSINSSIETIDVSSDEYFIIAPGQFVLASTIETISIPKNIAATLEGLSSVARLGLTVHAAGLVNAGTGNKVPTTLTLEISCQNSSPVKLYPGMRIVQIIFHQLKSASKTGYDERASSRYVGQKKQILI